MKLLHAYVRVLVPTPTRTFFFFLAIYLHGHIRNLVCEVSKWLAGSREGSGGGTAGKSFAFSDWTVDHADFLPFTFDC